MERFFALTMTDVLPDDMAFDRLASIADLASECGHLSRICVRNDSRNPDRFSEAAAIAADTEFDIILESSDPVCLRDAAAASGGCTLMVTDGSAVPEASMLSAVLGCPIIIPGSDVQELMDNAETAETYGASEILLNPAVRNMKSCLEINTDVHRLHAEHGVDLAGRPIVTRVWSGEYALSVASVSVMRYGTGVILDDLDPEGCRVLDALMSVEKT